MSTPTQETTTPPPPKAQNSLTQGTLPRWTWAAMLAGSVAVAAALAAALGAAFGAESFLVPLWVVLVPVIYLPAMLILQWVRINKRKAIDGFWKNLVYLAFLIALLPLVSVIWSVVSVGLPGLLAPGFLASDMSGITGRIDQETMETGGDVLGGIRHAIIGSLVITLAATVISVPIGLLTSIYLVEYSRGSWLSRAITFFVDVMTGIPSIVAGLFAAAATAWFISTASSLGLMAARPYTMGLTAAIALSVLMIPVVVRTTEEMLRVVPNELREASYALGVRKWRTILKVVIPTAISGIASGVTLSIARVIGETAPILVTAGFVVNANWNLVSGWMATLPVYIYRQFQNPIAPAATEPSEQRAWAAALVLIIIVMLLNLAARIIAQVFAPKKTGR